jgi:hypothetical protein
VHIHATEYLRRATCPPAAAAHMPGMAEVTFAILVGFLVLGSICLRPVRLASSSVYAAPPSMPLGPLADQLRPAQSLMEELIASRRGYHSKLDQGAGRKIWAHLHGGAALCPAAKAARADAAPKTPRCHNRHGDLNDTSVIIFGGHAGAGLTNQLMVLSQVLREACLRRRNVAGVFYPDMRGHAMRDLIELIDVNTVNRRLQRPWTRSMCVEQRDDRVDDRAVDCSSTQIVPMACARPALAAAAVDGIYPKEVHERFAIPKRHQTMFPWRPQLLYALELTHVLTWRSTACAFRAHHDAYNAIHFNVDADWVLFICSKFGTWSRLAGGHRLHESEKAARKRERQSLLSPTGKHAPFVRNVVIPQFILAMKVSFRDLSLPVVVCSSIGKLYHETLWIARELEERIRAAFGVEVIFGTTESKARELNAAAELHVLARAQSAVLWRGSTFSGLAAIHLAQRNASIGWAPDMRSAHLCNSSIDDEPYDAKYGMPSIFNKSVSDLMGYRPAPLRVITGREAACNMRLAAT